MYFVIRDNNDTVWAYGDAENGKNPSLTDICEYLLSSSKPEIFTLTFFDDTGIKKEVSLLDYKSGG